MIHLRIRPLTGKKKLFTNNVHTEGEEGDSSDKEMNFRNSTKIEKYCNLEQNDYNNIQRNDCFNEKNNKLLSRARMTTLIKANRNQLDKQTNIEKY